MYSLNDLLSLKALPVRRFTTGNIFGRPKLAGAQSTLSVISPLRSWFISSLALLVCTAAISFGISQGADVPKQLTMPAGGPGAATNLTANRYDDPAQPARALVKLQWTPASQQGTEQRIVVTIFSDGFQRGAFDVSSPLSSTQTSLVWDKLKGQAIHHWKVLTLQPSGWVLSQTGTFEGPTVIRDQIDRSDRR
jgi:hypothetical protein